MSIRARFVGEVLRDAGKRLLTAQEKGVRRSVKLRSGRILSARDIVVSGGEEMDGKLTYTHAVYERFLDMKRLGGQRKSSKRRRIHNRFGVSFSRLKNRPADHIGVKLTYDLLIVDIVFILFCLLLHFISKHI